MKLPRREFLHLTVGAAALPAVSRLNSRRRRRSMPTTRRRSISGGRSSGRPTSRQSNAGPRLTFHKVRSAHPSRRANAILLRDAPTVPGPLQITQPTE